MAEAATNRKWTKWIKWIVVALLVVAAAVAIKVIYFPGLPRPIDYDKLSWLPTCDPCNPPQQQWTKEERQWFYHTSQGSQLMPYAWFLALEQPGAFNRDLFIEPAHMSRFRILPNVDPVGNPDGLPLGFAKDPGTPGPGPVVGISCAGCHTALIKHDGQALIIDGAPGQLDLTSFLERVGLAAFTTLEDAKFDRFARRVLGTSYSPATKAQLRRQFGGFVKAQLKTILTNSGADVEGYVNSGLTPTNGGFGRLDALGQGGNTIFGKLTPKNLRVLNGPVNVIPLWYAGSYGWVQSNASIRQPMARNMIEAMAVNALLFLQQGPQQYDSSLRYQWMAEMEDMAARLEAPRWPESLLGELDKERVARGKVLYQQLCANCHVPQLETPTTNDGVPVVPGPYPPDPISVQHGRRFYHLRLFTFDQIGTDPTDAKNFQERTVDATALGMSANEAGANVIYTVISKTQQRGYHDNNVPPDTQLQWNGYRSNYWRAPLAYPARPLAGAWATSPYLHNGSVPNLYELLSPLKERSNSFYLGNPEFDPKRVGYESGWFYGGTKLDTSVTGNSNAGHEFDDAGGKGVIGRGLKEEERWDLIEFLKALRFEDEVPPSIAPPTAWPQNPGGSTPSAGDPVPQNESGTAQPVATPSPASPTAPPAG